MPDRSSRPPGRAPDQVGSHGGVRWTLSSVRAPEEPGRLCRLADHHDSDQDPYHSRNGSGSRSGDEPGDGSESGDDHRRCEAHGDRRTDVGRPGDDVVDGKDRDDAHEGDDPEPLPVERARLGLSWEHDLSRPSRPARVAVKATQPQQTMGSPPEWTGQLRTLSEGWAGFSRFGRHAPTRRWSR